MDTQRYRQEDLDAWHQDGAVVVRNFFSAEEIAPVYIDYARLYGTRGAGDGNSLSIDTGQPTGAFHPKQFVNLDTLPFDASVDMNLISLHPGLIRLPRTYWAAKTFSFINPTPGQNSPAKRITSSLFTATTVTTR